MIETAMITAMSWTVITGLVEAFALYFIRLGGIENIVKASLIYGMGVVPLLVKGVEYEGIGFVNFFWNVFSTLFGFGIGLYLFKEKIRKLQVIGVIISLLGLGLILMSSGPDGKSKAD
jgi:drug/metabolite transporter (DMT)-like permease